MGVPSDFNFSAASCGALLDIPAADGTNVGRSYRVTDKTPNYVMQCWPNTTGGYAWEDRVSRQQIHFGQPNVAAGDNATVASSTPVQIGFAGVTTIVNGWDAVRACFLTGISATLSGAAAGSNLIVGVYVDGTLADATAIVTLTSAGSDTKAKVTFAAGSIAIAAGSIVTVKIRTGSGWSATTVDLAVTVEIAN